MLRAKLNIGVFMHDSVVRVLLQIKGGCNEKWENYE
jgi:hypothetical protein